MTYRIGYFTAWLFDNRGMPLGMSYGQTLVIGAAGIVFVMLVGLFA